MIKYTDKNFTKTDEDSKDRTRRLRKLWRELNLGYDFIDNYPTPQIQYSLVLLLKGDELSIKSNGNHHEKDLFISGFMWWREVAYALPWDYDSYEDEAILRM